MDVPPLEVSDHRGVHVERLTDDVEDVAEHAVADRHGDAAARVHDDRSARQAVGRLHAHRPHPTAAELLGDLGRDDDGLTVDVDRHLDRVVDLRNAVGREFDVDHRSGDRDDPALLQLRFVVGHGHDGRLLRGGGKFEVDAKGSFE